MMIAFLLGNWQRFVAWGIVALLVVSLAELDGYRRGELKLFDYQAKEAREAIAVVKKIERVKEIIRVPYIKREIQIQTRFVTIEKETANVPVRPDCNVTRGWMLAHDAAASAIDDSIGRLDDATDTGITEVAALQVIENNYKTYHLIANDLKACRAFVRGLAISFSGE